MSWGTWISILNFPSMLKKPKCLLDDEVDRWSSWIGTSLMMLFCSITSAGLMLGSHFECMIPAQFTDEWKKFASSHCFIQPHFYVHDSNSDDEGMIRQIQYFPWLPYFFFFHGLAFYFPKFFWNHFANCFGMDVESILVGAESIKDLSGSEKKEKAQKLAAYMASSLGFYSNRGPSYCFLLAVKPLLFLAKKWLYPICAFIQLYAICIYIGQGDVFWGFEVIAYTLYKVMPHPSKFFPLFTFCKTPIAEDNLVRIVDVSCVLGMNVVYEKLYVFTYLMLIVIMVASSVSAAYQTVVFASPLHDKAIDELLGFKHSLVPFKYVKAFTRDYLGANGFLAISLIRNNFGDDVASLMVKELWNLSNPCRSPPSIHSPFKAQKPNQSMFSLPPHYTTLPLSPQ